MSKILIKNIGPLTHIELELNKVNVFMGPQSSGKSTIAKIISYCQWVEKRTILDGEFKYKVSEQLLEFHRLGENYFSKDSFFEYETEFVKISYRGRRLEESITLKSAALNYRKSKNIYIPSERNFVSTIPNLGRYKETNDNVMSFIYDWYSAKRKYTKQDLLPILNLGINFYTSEDSDVDVLILKENGKEIQLREGSSGLQSLIPLAVIIDYLTNSIYEMKIPKSVEETEALFRNLVKNGDPKFLDALKTLLNVKELNPELGIFDNVKFPNQYHKTNFIIEEPEQNLFPETQRDLMYYMFNKLKSERDHSLLITTHSPYILYAINNCLMGSLVANKIEAEELSEFLSKDAWISPSLVSIYEIDKTTGTLKSIKDEKTGTVSKHYFNSITNDIMNEYYALLNHFDYES